MAEYEMVIEQPSLSTDADTYDLLDADRNDNPDEDIQRGFMRLKNLNLVPVGTLSHGTMLIFVRKDQMDSLNFYLNEKSHEVYMYLIEKDGGARQG